MVLDNNLTVGDIVRFDVKYLIFDCQSGLRLRSIKLW